MRCLLKISIDTAAGNRAIADGTLPKLMDQLMEATKPEAAYFGTESGDRTAFIFFDYADASDMPMIAEPLFSALEARVSMIPVMNSDDLRKGLARLA
ncbi:MAG TPA: hypothetical protein VHC23_00360 [Jatrophihabitans sp.]|jgi:hypothetical protein|nr:hypothetical protein [Jatrophihabitans sp.]